MDEPRWVVETRALALGYDGRPVLDGIDLRIPAGALTCIIGGSGCGKSTLLRACVGLVRPNRGEVVLLGRVLDRRLGDEERAALMARVGFMFQEGGLLNSITVGDNLAIPMMAHTDLPQAVIRDLVKMKLALVRLEGAIDKLPSELSGGMKKRAGLARALMLDPEVIFCDEPSAGLDPVTAAELDRIVLLDQGGVHFDGPLAEALRSRDATLRAFFGQVAGDADGDDQAPTLDTLLQPTKINMEAMP